MGHTQIVGENGLFQCGAGRHPIPRLSALQSIDNEFRHSQPVQTPENTGGGPLQATSKEPKIKDWVVNEFLAIPTAQVFAKGFNKHSRATDDRSYRHVRPKCINHPTQCSDFLMRIAAPAIQGGHAHTRLKVSTSQVRRNTRTLSPSSSNSTLQLPCDLAQFKHRERIRGYIPFRIMD